MYTQTGIPLVYAPYVYCKIRAYQNVTPVKRRLLTGQTFLILTGNTARDKEGDVGDGFTPDNVMYPDEDDNLNCQTRTEEEKVNLAKTDNKK